MKRCEQQPIQIRQNAWYGPYYSVVKRTTVQQTSSGSSKHSTDLRNGASWGDVVGCAEHDAEHC
eukprot:2169875-Rhodomonas_salina.1